VDDEQPNNLPFQIKMAGTVAVVVWDAGGSRPATDAEAAMWVEIKRLRRIQRG
jgi:hypothetical protein